MMDALHWSLLPKIMSWSKPMTTCAPQWDSTAILPRLNIATQQRPPHR